MRAMTWSGVGGAVALQYNEIAVGQQYITGRQWPRFTDIGLFTPAVVYTITGVLDLGPLPIPPRGKYGTAPAPWDQNAGFPSPVADSAGYVTFNQDAGVYSGGARYPAGTWVAVTFLQYAQRIQ